MNNRKNSLLSTCSNKALLHANGLTADLAPLRINQSAYQSFLEKTGMKHQKHQKLPDEFIDYLVDSLIILGDNFEQKTIREKLRKGLKTLNQKSSTARQAIIKIPFGEKIKTEETNESSGGWVKQDSDIIFINKKSIKNDIHPYDLSLLFLHESEHLIERVQIRPIDSFNTGYIDTNNNEISFQKMLGLDAPEKFKLDKLMEAEKKAQYIQILNESLSYWERFKSILFSLNFSLPISNISKNTNDTETQTRVAVLGHTLAYKMDILKNILKKPKAIFNKELRNQIKEDCAKKGIATHIKFLITPQKENKGISLLSKITPFIMFCGIVASPVLGSIGLVSSLIAIGSRKSIYQARKNWNDYYNSLCASNSTIQDKESKQKDIDFQNVIDSFTHKYDGHINQTDIANSMSDNNEAETIIDIITCFKNLDKDTKNDLKIIAQIIANTEGRTPDNVNNIENQVKHEIVEKALNLVKTNNAPTTDPTEMIGLILKHWVSKNDIITPKMLKNVSQDDINNIKNPALSNILKERMLKEKQETNHKKLSILEEMLIFIATIGTKKKENKNIKNKGQNSR